MKLPMNSKSDHGLERRSGMKWNWTYWIVCVEPWSSRKQKPNINVGLEDGF
jgi:hypothetical protein